MRVATRRGSRLTDLAVGRHLSYRTVRARLTLLYGGLFLLSGAALMAIAYALLVNAGFVFTLQSAPPAGNQTIQQAPALGLAVKGSAAAIGGPIFPAGGSTTHPSARTMSHWRGVTLCMREHGIARFPEPTTAVPPGLAARRPFGGHIFRAAKHALKLAGVGFVSNRDGALLVIPDALRPQSPAFIKAARACGFGAGPSPAPLAQDDSQRSQVRQQLLIQSAIALAGMSLLSLGLGWLMAGRVLQPLEDSYHAQRQFVANASHELRAPLTRMRALSEVALASSTANFDSLHTAHERVLASERHLEQLIDALLALSRGQAGIQRRERLDLATIISQATAGRQAELGDLDLRATLATAPVDGDPRLLERLVANLIDNAIRHNAPGGHIEIATGTRDRHAFVTIANTGPTVRPEEIERLFQPFQRLGAARTAHHSGHGLGLSIVRAIADAHRAEVAASAREEGGLNIEIVFAPPAGARARMTFASAWRQRLSLRHGTAGDEPS